MKIRTLITMSVLAAILQAAPLAMSQPSPGGPGKNFKQNQRLANLSPEEREKVKKARKQAAQDPQVKAARDKVKAANKELRSAVEAAMVKADPSIKAVLDKLPKAPEPGPQED